MIDEIEQEEREMANLYLDHTAALIDQLGKGEFDDEIDDNSQYEQEIQEYLDLVLHNRTKEVLLFSRNWKIEELTWILFMCKLFRKLCTELANCGLKIKKLLHRSIMQVAEDAKTEKEQFYSAMSHDIRIPLNAIMGMTRIALENIDNKKNVNPTG